MEKHCTSSDVDLDEPEYDTEGAAEFLRCSAGHLSNLRNLGGGPTFHRKFKRRGIFYFRSDLQAWRLRNSFTSTTEY
ncbi:hypothetical protein ACVWZA_000526 [Sphingomonas sp. UYAg733]